MNVASSAVRARSVFPAVKDRSHRRQRWNAGRSGGSKETTQVCFEGQRIPVHDNVYMCVLPTDVCNAKCRFCSSELIATREQRRVSTKAFVFNVERALDMLEPLRPPISISGGGEPTLSARLPLLLETVHRRTDKLIIHTNGTRLLNLAPGESEMVSPPKGRWTVLEHLLNVQLNHLNWSIAHHCPKKNRELMKLPIELPVEDIEFCVDKAIRNNCRPRLSLVLLKDGINDLAGLKAYLNWAMELGVDDVLIRELAAFDRSSVAASGVAQYVDSQRISFDLLLDEIDEDTDFQYVSEKSGQTHYRENHIYRGAVDVGFLVYRFSDRAEQQAQRTVKFLVAHPSGAVSKSWEEGQGVIIPAPT